MAITTQETGRGGEPNIETFPISHLNRPISEIFLIIAEIVKERGRNGLFLLLFFRDERKWVQ